MQSLQEYREAGVERFQKKNIAAALGISLPAYDALENDQEHRMNPARAKALGEHFGVDPTIFWLKSQIRIDRTKRREP